MAFIGGGEANAAILGGQVDVGISGFGEWGSLMESGRIRLLAVASTKRLPGSDTPTFKELGLDLVFANWRGVVAPPSITQEQRKWYVNTVSKARDSQVWQETLKRNNWQDSFLTDDAFNQFIAQDSARANRILSRVGLAQGESWAAVGPFLFPTISGVGLMLMRSIIVFSSFKGRRSLSGASLSDKSAAHTELSDFDNIPETGRFLLVAVTVLIYIVGLRFIGFMYVTPALIVALSSMSIFPKR